MTACDLNPRLKLCVLQVRAFKSSASVTFVHINHMCLPGQVCNYYLIICCMYVCKYVHDVSEIGDFASDVLTGIGDLG